MKWTKKHDDLSRLTDILVLAPSYIDWSLEDTFSKIAKNLEDGIKRDSSALIAVREFIEKYPEVANMNESQANEYFDEQGER